MEVERKQLHLIIFLKLASSTLKMESMTGRGLVQRLITSRPMVITLQLGTKDNLRVNKGTGGLEVMKTHPPNQLPPGQFTDHYISFLIGGGCDINTIRAELIIDDKVYMQYVSTLNLCA